MAKTLGERIKERRQRDDLSLRQAAEQAGVNHQVLWRLEVGTTQEFRIPAGTYSAVKTWLDA